MSCRVLLSACPICSEPVTFGGGITIVNGFASRRSARPALNAPASSQRRDMRPSVSAGGVGFFNNWGPTLEGDTPRKPPGAARQHEDAGKNIQKTQRKGG